MRISEELKAKEKKWIGKKIRYYTIDALDKKSHGRKLDGPFIGIVEGLTNNGAMVEDRLEGNDHRSSVKFTGFLIVSAIEYPSHIDMVAEIHAEIISPPHRGSIAKRIRGETSKAQSPAPESRPPHIRRHSGGVGNTIKGERSK